MNFATAAARASIVGLDIGGSKTEAIVVDREFNIRGSALRPTDVTAPQALMRSITATVYEALERGSVAPDQVATIGVGVPGQVISETGEVHLAANLHLEKYPLGEAVAAEFEVPVVVENDVRAAALGSHRFEWDERPCNMAYVNVGTGVSAGLILGGKLYRGTYGMAGEIGHVVVDPGGPPCNCGARGCLETLVAGPALARAGEHAIRRGEETILRQALPLNAEDVYQAAKSVLLPLVVFFSLQRYFVRGLLAGAVKG